MSVQRVHHEQLQQPVDPTRVTVGLGARGGSRHSEGGEGLTEISVKQVLQSLTVSGVMAVNTSPSIGSSMARSWHTCTQTHNQLNSPTDDLLGLSCMDAPFGSSSACFRSQSRL